MPAKISAIGACSAIARVVGLMGFPGILTNNSSPNVARKRRTHTGLAQTDALAGTRHAALSRQGIKGHKQIQIRRGEVHGI
jgi:hypothetical protein